ncbi:MAG: hypothetical protein DRP01_04955 [Archaeoglobales archaeon]|nr:MAG: hypothetical protein DRP01_04955 [Archaeoglobales archaeon]
MKPKLIWKSKFLSDTLQDIHPEFTLISISDDRKKLIAAVIWKEVEKRFMETGFIFKTKKIVESEVRKCYLCVLDIENGNILQNREITLPEIPDEFMDVAVTDDSELVIAGCHYNTRNIYCYKERSGIMVFDIPYELRDRYGYFNYYSIIISKDGYNVLLYVNYYLCVFNIKKGVIHHFLIGRDCDKFTPAKKCEYIAYKCGYHLVSLKDYHGREIWRIGYPYLKWVRDLAVSKNGGYILVWTDSDVYLFNKDGGELWKKPLQKTNIPMSSSKAAITDNGETLVVSGNELYFLDKKGEVIWNFELDNFVENVDISRDGDLIALIDDHKNIYLLHAKAKDLPVEIPQQVLEVVPRNFPIELAEFYTEIEFIGIGGFAKVFKAKRKKDGKTVAIKIPISFDSNIIKSFEREIVNWSKLDHPNIVKVYNYNISPLPYIEMEFCGSSLADIDKPVEPEKAAWIIFNVAEGLKYAHNLGIIHRDLKPQNILFKGNIPKISDWGLSKVIAKSKSTSITAFTPYYASPEQISKKPKDQRTDIWQLGVIFYELVTGDLPFKGESIVEIGIAITTQQPTPPSKLNPEAKEVERIIMKCLEKNPENRYQSIEELQKDLANVLNVSYQKSLKKVQRDFRRSAYYCGELLLLNLKIKDVASAYKFASDLINYANEELKPYIVNLCDEMKFWMNRDISDDAIQELIKKAEIIVHKLRVGFKLII